MVVDTHAHLMFDQFKDEVPEVLARAAAAGVCKIINIGCSAESSAQAVELVGEFGGREEVELYATLGLHPYDAMELSDDLLVKWEEWIKDSSNKVVAIGEIGLDYWHIPENMDFEEIKGLQKDGLIPQLEFAKKNDLPVIFHARGSKDNPIDAYDDLYEIVKDRGLKGVVHSFDSRATKEVAKKFLDLGMYIGFNGVITFKNKSVDNLREIVKFVPLDRILVETDAPYLTPEPHRGEKNKPQNVEFVACKVGEIKNINFSEVAKATAENFGKLFNLHFK